jgi:hypothetical protein
MPDVGSRHVRPRLKELIVEASRALARLDVERLEELARSCRALNRALALGESTVQNNLFHQADLCGEAAEAAGEMAVFSRVLDVTRENLIVANRLRALRQNALEYSESQIRVWTRSEPQTSPRTELHTESGYGDN